MSVSIHATLAGGDTFLCGSENLRVTFLSTPPSRVATELIPLSKYTTEVSIHATLAGGDLSDLERLSKLLGVSIHATLAGGDDKYIVLVYNSIVSIHATLAGGDCKGA